MHYVGTGLAERFGYISSDVYFGGFVQGDVSLPVGFARFILFLASFGATVFVVIAFFSVVVNLAASLEGVGHPAVINSVGPISARSAVVTNRFVRVS